MSSTYEGAWQPVALLSFANFFSCIGAFFGTTYVVTKESKKAFLTTAIGAVVNIVLTLVLVPVMGIMGAAAATVVSYVVIALVRARDTRKFVEINFSKGEIVVSLAIITMQVTLSLFPYNSMLLYMNFALFVVLIVVLYRSVTPRCSQM